MSSGLHAGRSATAGIAPLRARVAAALHSRAAPWTALAVLVILTGALLYHETRGTTIWFDEWIWVLHRRGGAVGSLLDSHNGHLSLIPVAIYKLLWATFGIRDYAPYRLMVIVAHLVCCVLLFVYARRRVGPLAALVATTLLLLFGPGWENLLWPFQVTWLLSLGAGLGALLALDRHARGGDIAASVLLAISLASSSIGVPIAFGLIVELALTRRRRRDAWIVAAPVALYALWSIGYQQSSFTRGNLELVPGFAANGLAATFAGLAGLGGTTSLDQQGTLLTWGPPLLVVAIALAAWRLTVLRRFDPRVIALTAMLVGFWLLTAFSRTFFGRPYSSRYLYVSALLVLLLAVELLRGVAFRRWIGVALVVLAAGAILSNVGDLRDSAGQLRISGQTTAADLGALEIARPVVAPGYIAQGLPGYPFVQVSAGAYFAVARALGTPAVGPAAIAADPENVRETVDGELIRMHGLALGPGGPGPAPAAPLTLDSITGGARSARGSCVEFLPDAFTRSETIPALSVTVPPGGLSVQAIGGPATIAVRRFADRFQPFGTLSPGGPQTLTIAPDRSTQPWHVQVAPAGRALVCGLG